jgi:hypothetical protein
MVALTDKEKQVIDLIGSLPPERRRLVLYELARDSASAWQRNTAYAEEQLRNLAAARNLKWDQMDDEQRQDFVNDLLSEEN